MQPLCECIILYVLRLVKNNSFFLFLEGGKLLPKLTFFDCTNKSSLVAIRAGIRAAS